MRRHLVFLILTMAMSTRAADTAPDWVRELSTRTLPALPSEARSATMLDEARATVDERGNITTLTRHAIRVLSIEGRQDAMADIPYLKGAGKIKDFGAWLIPLRAP
jgi:hypothetical protein